MCSSDLLLLVVPGLQRAFGFGSVEWIDAAEAVGITLVGLSWFEVYKLTTARSVTPPA